MLGSVCVLSRVTIRRAVATQRHAAGLTRSQVNPATPDLHTLFTRTPLRKLNKLDRLDVLANFFSHTPGSYTYTAAARSRVASAASSIMLTTAAGFDANGT
jgi:hypothetical protein